MRHIINITRIHKNKTFAELKCSTDERLQSMVFSANNYVHQCNTKNNKTQLDFMYNKC